MSIGAENNLGERWQSLKEENPKIRIRDAAAQLNTSEAQLLATTCGATATRLEGDWSMLLQEVPKLGKVMALTRNEHAVHERKGIYKNPDFSSPHAALFLGEDIDLRLFMTQWKYGFAVQETVGKKERRSLQFFNGAGEALHKIYLQEESVVDEYDDLVGRYRSSDQGSAVAVSALQPKADKKPDSDIDVAGFQREWLALQDTHDFFMLLRKFGVGRVQGLRLAPEGHAYRVDTKAVRIAVTAAAESNLPIMVFVGNGGALQIHTGPVERLLDYENWFNVMDPDFNLHLREDAIAECWVVRKPTEDGIVTSVEAFSADGELIITLFGKRKPGIPEDTNWRELVTRTLLSDAQ